MADYFTSTVLEPEIPDSDITALERLLLSNIFQAERYDGATYLFSEQGPSDMVFLKRATLASALADSEATESGANAFIKEHLATADGDEVELDMSGPGWEFLVQDIVKRSATIPYVIVKSAFTCSKMRPDGFGGSAMLITADEVMAKSTYDLIEEFEAKAKVGPATDATSDKPDVPLLEAARIASVQMQNAIELLSEYAETDRWAEAIHEQLVRDEAMLRAAIADKENET